MHLEKSKRIVFDRIKKIVFNKIVQKNVILNEFFFFPNYNVIKST